MGVGGQRETALLGAFNYVSQKTQLSNRQSSLIHVLTLNVRQLTEMILVSPEHLHM